MVASIALSSVATHKATTVPSNATLYGENKKAKDELSKRKVRTTRQCDGQESSQ